MNTLIEKHYGGKYEEWENAYHLYECSKRSGTIKYLILVHGNMSEQIEDSKILLRSFICAPPLDWSLDIIKIIDSKLSRLQLSPNSKNPYLKFSTKHTDYVVEQTKEIIENINEAYLRVKV